MRRNRIIWFILWILSLVGISFYGGPVSYGLFTMLTLVPVFSLLYLFYVYMCFHIYQKLGKRYVVVNETVPFYFNLVNDYFLLFAGIRVIFYSSFSTISELSDEIEYELTPQSGIEKETKMVCHYRGDYHVGIKRIEIQDYFRLFKISYKNKESISAIVKPQLVKLEQLGDIDLVNSIRDTRAYQSEPDVIGREYVPGDEPRYINWSQTAREGRLMTRNLTGEEFQEISIIMETCRTGKEQQEFLPVENKLLETTLAIAYYLSRKNLRTSEYHCRQTLVHNIVAEESRLDEFYENMSAVQFNEDYSHAALVDSLRQNRAIFSSPMVFLVLSFWDEAATELVGMLVEHNIHVVIYLITDSDNELSAIGHYARVDILKISPFDNLLEVLV